MVSKHTTQRSQKAYERLYKRVPAWLPVDHSLISNLADLQFQLEHQIDLYEEHDLPAIKTKAQCHRVKMLLGSVLIARAEEARR